MPRLCLDFGEALEKDGTPPPPRASVERACLRRVHNRIGKRRFRNDVAYPPRRHERLGTPLGRLPRHGITDLQLLLYGFRHMVQ